jgi:hypothetical protein
MTGPFSPATGDSLFREESVEDAYVVELLLRGEL